MKLILGDSLQKLKDLPTNTVDACVCDPPYGLSFMGKKWDCDVPSEDLWREVFRVMKPGAHLLSFFGTRTYHAGVTRIEAAGFEIRDMLAWLYGSGFPKSQNVSIQIDKQAGVMGHRGKAFVTAGQDGREDLVGTRGVAIGGHEPISPDAKRWQGWGTALKPANEPIVLARKPLEKGLTVAQNVLRWGTGALAIDASRIGMTEEDRAAVQAKANKKDTTNNIIAGFGNNTATHGDWSMSKGRWPANVLFDEEAAAALDEQSIAGGIHSAGKGRAKKENFNRESGMFGIGHAGGSSPRFEDGENIGASRFFYVAKASKRERNAGLEHLAPTKSQGARPNSADPSGKFPDHDHRERGGNNHPTVKPIKLMEYLCRMVTPPGGIILDPFLGSGTTLAAAARLGFQGIGIEMSEEYLEIARKRIAYWQSQADEPAPDDDQMSFPEVPA